MSSERAGNAWRVEPARRKKEKKRKLRENNLASCGWWVNLIGSDYLFLLPQQMVRVRRTRSVAVWPDILHSCAQEPLLYSSLLTLGIALKWRYSITTFFLVV
jgi:hypothetical protein